MLDFLAMIIFGLILGTAAGIVPGIHPNTFAIFISSLAPLFLLAFSVEAVIIALVAMAISNSFVNFIPSTFLGSPNEETALSVLPAHKFLQAGRAYEAIYLTVVGGVASMGLVALFLPLLLFLLPFFYSFVNVYIHWLLLGLMLFMIFTEQKKLMALVVILLSGLLGIFTFSVPLPSHLTLFPVFAGLFGISSLILSLHTKTHIPPQTQVVERGFGQTALKGSFKALFSGMVVGILPGIGSAQAATLVHSTSRKPSLREYLVSVGGINTITALFSLLALYLIAKPRSGIALAIQHITANISFSTFLLIVCTALIATGISALVTLWIARRFTFLIQTINYRLLTKSIIIFLVFLTVVLTGPVGALILFTSTGIGLLAPLFNIRRTHAMNVLMVPIILFYFGLLV